MQCYIAQYTIICIVMSAIFLWGAVCVKIQIGSGFKNSNGYTILKCTMLLVFTNTSARVHNVTGIYKNQCHSAQCYWYLQTPVPECTMLLVFTKTSAIVHNVTGIYKHQCHSAQCYWYLQTPVPSVKCYWYLQKPVP